jgi:hypothetical protein
MASMGERGDNLCLASDNNVVWEERENRDALKSIWAEKVGGSSRNNYVKWSGNFARNLSALFTLSIQMYSGRKFSLNIISARLVTHSKNENVKMYQ